MDINGLNPGNTRTSGTLNSLQMSSSKTELKSTTTIIDDDAKTEDGTGMYESITISAEIVETKASFTQAAVYEKSSDEDASQTALKNPKNNKVDMETIEKLKADADERNAQLKGIVEKLLLKQGGTILNSEGLASVYRKLEVDEETQKQAQADVAEDGYWGVEQTSDRILDFAKALAGDNVEFAMNMLEAIKEGFKQAGIDWGEDLPDLSQQTMEATLSKVGSWIESLGGSVDGAGSVSGRFTQADYSEQTVKINVSYTKVTGEDYETMKDKLTADQPAQITDTTAAEE